MHVECLPGHQAIFTSSDQLVWEGNTLSMEPGVLTDWENMKWGQEVTSAELRQFISVDVTALFFVLVRSY